nr:putative protein TPRXL [Onthophagus taurus]XP_022911309.1 putative protein TPRXL [Onthophagus taurus]
MDDNMSGGDSTGDSSDGEVTEDLKENSPSIIIPANFPTSKSSQHQLSPSTTTTTQGTTSSSTIPISSSTNSTNSSKPSTTTSQPIASSGVVYQTPHGLMYAAPSNGNVIFGLARTNDQNLPHGSQLLIPLSVMATNGQGELDLSKRK